MLCRWSILATLCLNLLVSALNFHGVGDVAVGDNVSLGFEMGKDDNFDPFDLILRSTESDRAQTMLQHITNVSSTFTVLISIPQVPDGFYIYFAAEPDSDDLFSRSDRFLITTNATNKNSTPPQLSVPPFTSTIPSPTSSTSVSVVTPPRTSSSSSPPPSAPRMDIQKEIETIKAENTRLLIIISAISALLGLGLVAGLIIYLRHRERRWLQMVSPIQFEPPRESVVRLGVPRIPEPKFSSALSDSLDQVHSGHSDTFPRSDHVRMASSQVTIGRGTRLEDPPPVYV